MTMETRQQRRYREREEAASARRGALGIKVRSQGSAGFELAMAIQREVEVFERMNNEECMRLIRSKVAMLTSNNPVNLATDEPDYMRVEYPQAEGERTRIYIHEHLRVI